jgi:hypothetical protein
MKRSMRGGAVVARLAHNQEVAGANPAPATSMIGYSSPTGRNQRLRSIGGHKVATRRGSGDHIAGSCRIPARPFDRFDGALAAGRYQPPSSGFSPRSPSTAWLRHPATELAVARRPERGRRALQRQDRATLRDRVTCALLLIVVITAGKQTGTSSHSGSRTVVSISPATGPAPVPGSGIGVTGAPSP